MAIEKWTNAKLIKYHAVGVHKGRRVRGVRRLRGQGRRSRHRDGRVHVGQPQGPDHRPRDHRGWQVHAHEHQDPTAPTAARPSSRARTRNSRRVSHKLISPEQIQITGSRTYPAAMVPSYPGGCNAASPAECGLVGANGMSLEALGQRHSCRGGGLPIASASADRSRSAIKRTTLAVACTLGLDVHADACNDLLLMAFIPPG